MPTSYKKFEKQEIAIGRVGSPPPVYKGCYNLVVDEGFSSWVGLIGMRREVCDLFTGVYLGLLPARQQPHLAWSHQRLYPFHCFLHPHPQVLGFGMWPVHLEDPPGKL